MQRAEAGPDLTRQRGEDEHLERRRGRTIPPAIASPPGTFAKKETISRISDVSGMRTSPLKNMWMAKPHSAVNSDSQSSHSSSSLLTTPPSSVIQLVRPKNAQAIAPAWTTTSTAIMNARNRYAFMARMMLPPGPGGNG